VPSAPNYCRPYPILVRDVVAGEHRLSLTAANLHNQVFRNTRVNKVDCSTATQIVNPDAIEGTRLWITDAESYLVTSLLPLDAIIHGIEDRMAVLAEHLSQFGRYRFQSRTREYDR
jgi:hypothetical protein